jgi:hypothetical protein
MKPFYFVSMAHYYGDIVRKLFFAAAILMLAGLPFFNDQLPVSTIWSLAAIVTIGFLAGITNPVKQLPAWINTIASGVGVIIFEYFSVENFQTSYGGPSALFYANQALAIIFLAALYFGTKTLRAMIIDQNT